MISSLGMCANRNTIIMIRGREEGEEERILTRRPYISEKRIKRAPNNRV